jgi:hypothetical protein
MRGLHDWLAEAILPVHVVWTQIDLKSLPDHLVHVSGFGGQDDGVLEWDTMAQAYVVFGHSQFIWMLQTNVLVVLLDHVFNGTASLPNVNLTTFAGHTVHWQIRQAVCSLKRISSEWSLEYQVILHRPKEAGNLPWCEAHRLTLYLDRIRLSKLRLC